MLIPYRVKNPVKQFPFVTVSIIGMNVLVFAFTSDFFVSIKEDVVTDYAFALGRSELYKFFIACFLHGDLFHLLGNMLFLWVFGPPVEDRLGIPRYIALYLITGAIGDFLQAVIDIATAGMAMPTIGASGCIMGVVGAYWYLYSWSTVCVFYYLTWMWHGVKEVAAIWIIMLFMAMDLLEGVLYGTTGVSGGVANFAHLGGAFTGALMCFMMQIKRDSAYVSEAKAVQADVKDFSLMPLDLLHTMLDEDRQNPEIIRALIGRALGQDRRNMIDEAMKMAGMELIDTDPGLVAYYLVSLKGDPSIYTPTHIIRLASILERQGNSTQALQLLRVLVDTQPNASDTEVALYRMACCCWQSMKDANGAHACLDEMDRRFPNGSMALEARNLRRRIGVQV